MKNKLEYNAYSVDEVKGVVTYAVKSHGKVFVGVSRCSGTDKFDVETGKRIAYLRAQIMQRKFDKSLTQDFIDWVSLGMDDNNKQSPHYMHALQMANDEKKAQENHINKLTKELKVILDKIG